MFLPPGNTPTSTDGPSWAGNIHRPLHDRIVETLRYLSDEIELRQAGGLGEAQAAGYVAGRVRRAEYAAAVQSFRTGVGERVPLVLLAGCATVAGAVAAVDARLAVLVPVLLVLVLVVVLVLAEIEGPEPLRRLMRGKMSQSVVAGRAATARTATTRVVILAPLDGPPQAALGRDGLLILLAAMIGEALGVVALLFGPAAVWRIWLALCVSIVALLAMLLIGRRFLPAPRLAVSGAGELTTLLMLAEELESFEYLEVWIVALGGSTVGQDSIRALIRRYPFTPADTYILNLHNISSGDPVFVSREGVLRERRSDRLLFALASEADAADLTIDAEPQRLRQRTLAQSLLRRRFPAMTITSHSMALRFSTPDAATIERCVKLVVEIVRRLDAHVAG